MDESSIPSELRDAQKATVKQQHKELRQRLDNDPKIVEEIVSATKEPAPFLFLADSVNSRLPALPVEVLRALFLG